MTNSKNVPVFRSAYTPHSRLQIDFPNPTRTKQASAAECDINILMKRYEKDGIVAHLNEHKGQYGNFLGIPDYQDALNRIQEASDVFNSLPATIRKKFNNDPGAFVDFATNPDNLSEMVDLGLANPPIPSSKEEFADADTSTPPSHEDNLKTASEAVEAPSGA